MQNVSAAVIEMKKVSLNIAFKETKGLPIQFAKPSNAPAFHFAIHKRIV